MDSEYWAGQIGEAQEALEQMGPVENLRLILWLLLVDRVDSIATSLHNIDQHLAAKNAPQPEPYDGPART